MSYIAQRVCEFNDVTYFVGDTIPDGVIQDDAATRLIRMGWIRVGYEYAEERSF